ncbi:hypothetical protein [Chryseobacterium mulctrae]|uniref:hypothetical protein n=1 Tax=Chryseobacterium mulctrae TaxID=2576777 RepID=UPI001115AE46|nr:hypothetical protein [Chryseobacterium mulctrae]
MRKNYTSLIEKVKNRSNPDFINESVLFNKAFSDELGQLKSSGKQVLEYVKRSMNGVEARYTERTIEAGDNVKGHLKRNNSSVDYRYQGSVMSNTHIKGHSDIDLIQITNSFYSHEIGQNFSIKYISEPNMSMSQKQKLLNVINATPYSGNSNSDLRLLRLNAEVVLLSTYKNVDTDKAKSIEVNPSEPNRIVDVVTASWYRSVESEFNEDETQRGIQIYDKEKNERLATDFPFLKISLINERSKETGGRLKKMIRFTKTLKADSEQDLRGLSSFDICSVCYNIPIHQYFSLPYYQLVYILYTEFKKISENEVYRNSIKSIDGTEYIFYNKPEKIRLLRLLYEEILFIYEDLLPNTTALRFL